MKLTKNQQLLLDIEKITGGSVNVICGSIIYDKVLDTETMINAAEELFRKNPILNIRLKYQDGVLHQEFPENKKSNIKVLHFDTKEEYFLYADNLAKTPLDLSASLCEMTIAVSDCFCAFLYKMHHVMSDGWTIALLGSKVHKILDNEDLPIYSYTPHIENEEKYLNSKRYEKDKLFFTEQFKKCNTPVLLSDKDIKSYNAERRSFFISKNNVAKIKEFSIKKDISVFTLFFSSLSFYFSKTRDNAENFYLSTPIVNRALEDEKNTAGLFMNLVPVLAELNYELNTEQNMRVLQDNLNAAMRHQKFNYKDIAAILNEEYHFSGKLYDVILSFQNAQIISEKSFETKWHHNGTQFESLQIHIEDRDNTGGFRIHYDYQTEKFTEKDINNLHNQLCNILSSTIKNPDEKLMDLNILSESELHKILYEFNDTAVSYPTDKCVHTLFEEQAIKTPDKNAVIACDRTLTYEELNSQANRIAHSLIKNGVNKGDIVAFMLPRESCLLPVLLGILKAGGCYMPVDPDYPQHRIDYMLEDSNSKLCITQNNISEFLNHCDNSNPNIKVSPESNYCVIYTSGSTGNPKGCFLKHKGIVNFCINSNVLQYFKKIGIEPVGISVNNVTFDYFIAETIVLLANGHKTVLCSKKDSVSPKAFWNLCKKHGVNLIQTTPTRYNILLEKEFIPNGTDIKLAVTSGEPLSGKLYKKISDYLHSEIFNSLGPSECSVWVLGGENVSENDIHIGAPIANTQIYVLDKFLKPVPIGVTGELCIAGDCVGAGYLNREKLTNEKFIDNPFGDGKLYKTGDMVYWREDGNIAYVGRNDFQVKIRGLRIELGEIENTISSVDGVVQSVVVVRKNENRQLICAFYTQSKHTELSHIKKAIIEKLPKYMMPHVFTVLDELPLTSSGKVNRNALPEIDFNCIFSQEEYLPPVTKKESLLCDSIESVLKTNNIGLKHNFFDMGGDSLKAIELISLLERNGYTLEVKDIFDSLTVKEIAEKMSEAQFHNTVNEHPDVLPLTPAQMKIYTSQMMKADSTHNNIPYIFKTKNLDRFRLENALNALISRHESLRTHFENRNGDIVQVVEKNASVTLTQLPCDDFRSFITPFDLTKAPLMHVGFYENTVIIDLHHIIIDGESFKTFFGELNELYMNRPVAKKAVQYGEFVIPNQSYEKEEKYWLEKFIDDVPSLDLPTDFKRGQIQSFNGAAHYSLIDASLHEQIESKSKELNVTPFIYYMACCNILLSKISGKDDICVGTPISGRNSKNLEAIGMFVNTAVLRNSPAGNKTVAEFISQVKKEAINAIANQNYPFGELVKKLGISIGEKNPIFDVMLSYQSESMTDILFGDEKAILLPSPLSGVKCDINFNIMPVNNDAVLLVEYCTDLYKEETVISFVNKFNTILKRCLDCDSRISEISIIDDADTHKILYDFNNTSHSYDIPENSTLYSLFELQCKKTPDKICIKNDGEDVTFQMLYNYSGRLDSYLRKITANKKSVIGVIADRSIEMYAAIYGIIKGGNAYLPISPDYPRERIDYILSDSNAAAVVVQDKYKHLAPSEICVNMTQLISASGPCDEYPCNADENDTAYVIYTSGSTGNPKGAKVSHKSAVNRILWMHDKYPLNKNDVILQKTPYTFDVSVWEIFWWGICGGTLAFSKPQEHFLPAKIINEVCKNKITHLHFVPSVFDLFLTYIENNPAEKAKFSSVKHVFLSGEALNEPLVKRFYKLFSFEKHKIVNLYGPTECAVDVTFYDCTPGDSEIIPIGKPIYNTQMYIIDKHLNLVPIGITGELCIAGMNVGQGYINNEELTNEKFIDNPFGAGKLYKTGDLACFKEDGNIVFCGRRDSQIKLHGQRIELSEIENTINSVKGVDSCAVIVKDSSIIAFFCSDSATPDEVLKKCEQKLPPYMVPAAIEKLTEMPLTPNGKLDRKKLLSTELNRKTEKEYAPPETPAETIICDLFSKTLAIEKISKNDNFFSLGGSSLDMISILSEEYFKDISSSDFILNPTPAKLALLMTKKKDAKMLKTLAESENSSKALILVPYAGGGAEAFAKFVGDFKKISSDYSLYFIDYLHSDDEFKMSTDEVIALSQEKEISIYAHCAGSAVAMKLINNVEEKSQNVVKRFVSGGFIPPEKAQKENFWDTVDDETLKQVLSSAGADFMSLAEEKISEILKKFRYDTDCMTKYLYSEAKKINCPVYSVISKTDLFTQNYESAEKLWKIYADNFMKVSFIETDSHYFQSKNTKQLIEIIFDGEN